MIDERLAASLSETGRAMAEAQDRWWIIGSAAVALHGADPGRVADIDVLLSLGDAMRILPAIGIGPRRGSAHTDFRSEVFGRWTAPALPVEFMAGFRHRTGDEWTLVDPASRHGIDLDGVAVFIPDRAELCDLLRAFGRPKDIERASRLAALPG